jgi:hypothetical protein
MRVFNKAKSLTTSIAVSSLYVLVRGLVILALVSLALSTAVFEYCLLYQLLIPVTLQRAEIPLQSVTLGGVGSFKQGTLQVGSDIILQNEKYELAVILTVPESQVNFDIGNFNITLAFSEEHKLSGLVRTTQGILKYTNPVLRACRTFVFIVPLLLGWLEEAQEVRILLNASFSNYDELKAMTLMISPKELQVYKAELQLTTKLEGLRLVMHKYFYISLVLSISALFLVNCLVFTGLFYLRYTRVATPVSSHPGRPDLEKVYELTPRPEAQCFPANFSHILRVWSNGRTVLS